MPCCWISIMIICVLHSDAISHNRVLNSSRLADDRTEQTARKYRTTALNFKTEGVRASAPLLPKALQTRVFNCTWQGVNFPATPPDTQINRVLRIEKQHKFTRSRGALAKRDKAPTKRSRRHSLRPRAIGLNTRQPTGAATRVFCSNHGNNNPGSAQPMRGDNVDRITSRTILWVAVFLPFPQGWTNGVETFNQFVNNRQTDVRLQSIWDGILQSFADINNDSNVLENYELCLEAVDTPCNIANGIQSLFTQMKRRPETLALIGPSCNHVTRELANTVRWWNLLQVSFSTNDIIMSNRDLYPTFTRTVPSLRAQYVAVVTLLQYYKWSVVDVIHSNSATGFKDFNNFLAVLASTGISIGVSTPYHPIYAGLLKGSGLEKLNSGITFEKSTRNNVKIFLGDGADVAVMFCQISRKYPNLNPSRKVWLLTGSIGDHLWQQSASDCSGLEMEKVTSGHLLVDARSPIQTKDPDSTEAMRSTMTSSVTSYAYDSILVVAKALDAAVQSDGPGENVTWQGNQTLRENLLKAFNEVQVKGRSGNISFKDGERIGAPAIRQFINGTYKTIGHYDMMTSQLVGNGTKIMWPGNRGPPLASPKTIFQVQYLSVYVMAGVVMSSFVGITLTLGFLAFNIKNRAIRIIKMSSPNLNNVIAAGCGIAYVSLILMTIESNHVTTRVFDALCKIRQFLPPCAFTLAFGTMFLKTWRVHAIFTNVTVKKQVIKDLKLLGFLGMFLFVDLIILVTWFAVDPMTRVVKNTTNEIWKEGGQFLIIPQDEYCTSHYTFIWMAVVCSYKGILLVFGLFLAWSTRHVALPTLNDSKYIGVSVYITVIMCVIGPTSSFALKEYKDLSYAVTSLTILLCTTATLCLVFVPKVTAFRRLGDGPDTSMHIRLQGLKSQKERQPLRSLVSMTVSPVQGSLASCTRMGNSTVEDKQSSSTTEPNNGVGNEDNLNRLRSEKKKLEKDLKEVLENREKLNTLSPDVCYKMRTKPPIQTTKLV